MNLVINDFNIYYEKFGTGKKEILILPGWGDTRRTFLHMIHTLEENHTIYILDYPGFGNSPFPNRHLTVYDYAKLIDDFMKIVGLKNPVIIAHSFGARLAIILSSKYKVKIDRLIILDGAGIKRKKTIYQRIKGYTYKLFKKASILLPKKLKKKYLEKLVQLFGSKDYKALSDEMKKTFSNIVSEDLSYLLKGIKQETLLIWGENDLDTPLSDGVKMNEEILDSGLIIIKNSGHFSYLDNPFQVENILHTYLLEDELKKL